MTTEARKDDWERSYGRNENFVFYPNEEVVRFVSKYIRQRTGLNEFQDKVELAADAKILDVGCGIGRHCKFVLDMQMNPYGVDLSSTAISVAKEWLAGEGLNAVNEHLLQGDLRGLKFDDNFFDYAVSHGVLDSMSFDIALATAAEVSRVLKKGGLFYCNLLCSDGSGHPEGFAGEVVLTREHEKGTVQSYFDRDKVERLFSNGFALRELLLTTRHDAIKDASVQRWHAVAEVL